MHGQYNNNFDMEEIRYNNNFENYEIWYIIINFDTEEIR